MNERIHRARCIDGDLLAELFPDRPAITQAKPTREQRGCVASRDIGMYACPYGCVYRYANSSHAAAVKRRQLHNSNRKILLKS